MGLIDLASVILAVAALIDAPAATAPASAPPPTYDVRFAPLLGAEHNYAALGPAGPYYPQAAVNARKAGEAILECQQRTAGALGRCTVVSETPAGLDFAAAALAMARRQRIVAQGAPVDAQVIRVRVPFTPGAPVEIAH